MTSHILSLFTKPAYKVVVTRPGQFIGEIVAYYRTYNDALAADVYTVYGHPRNVVWVSRTRIPRFHRFGPVTEEKLDFWAGEISRSSIDKFT